MKEFYADLSSEFRSFLEYIKYNKLLVILVTFFSLFAYGIPLTQYTLSIDEENAIFRGNENYSIWSSQGRFGLSFLKIIFHYPVANSITSTFLAVILLALSSMLWAYVFRIKTAEKVKSFRNIIIAILFLTFPAYAENIGFAMMSFELGIGWVLTTITVFLLAQGLVYKKHKYYNILAVLCIAFVTSVYQAFLPVIICGISVIILIQLESIFQKKENVLFTYYFKIGLRIIFLIVLGLILYKLIDIVVSLFVPSSMYIDSFYTWGTESTTLIFSTLWDYYKHFLKGEIIYGSQIILPTLIVSILLLAIHIFRLFKSPSLRGTVCSSLLYFIVLLLSPFLMSFILGTSVLVRANFVWALFITCIWGSLYSLIYNKILKVIMIAAMLLVAFYQSNSISTLFYSDYNRYQDDVNLAGQINSEIQKLGVGETPIVPVSFVGNHPQQLRENLIKGEVLGHSFFEWDNGNVDRIGHFMNSLGYKYIIPNEQQRQEGEKLAQTMPPWPYEGSVDLKNGLIIVNFANHTSNLAAEYKNDLSKFNLKLSDHRDDHAQADKVLLNMDLQKANTNYYSDLTVRNQNGSLQLKSGKTDPNISLSFTEPVDNHSISYIKINLNTDTSGEMRMYLLQTGDTYTEKYSGSILLQKGTNIIYCKKQDLLMNLAALRIDPPNQSTLNIKSIQLIK